MRQISPWLLPLAALALAVLVGCENDPIEKINPANPRIGPAGYPLPQAEPVPELTRAGKIQVFVEIAAIENHEEVTLTNRSDGAVYGLQLVVNNDYYCTVPLLEMGAAVRIPPQWLKTREGRVFPPDGQVRMIRVEVRHDGKVIASRDKH